MRDGRSDHARHRPWRNPRLLVLRQRQDDDAAVARRLRTARWKDRRRNRSCDQLPAARVASGWSSSTTHCFAPRRGQNVGFGLPGSNARDAKVTAALNLVDLSGFERRKVQSSPGETATGGARAPSPGAAGVALDSAVEPHRRCASARAVSFRQSSSAWDHTVFVTQSRKKHLTWRPRGGAQCGHLEQTGSPEELYEHRQSLCRTFVGRRTCFVARGARTRVDAP